MVPDARRYLNQRRARLTLMTVPTVAVALTAVLWSISSLLAMALGAITLLAGLICIGRRNLKQVRAGLRQAQADALLERQVADLKIKFRRKS